MEVGVLDVIPILVALALCAKDDDREDGLL